MFVLREGTYSKGKRPNCNLGRHKFESYRTHVSKKLMHIFYKVHLVIIDKRPLDLILKKLFKANKVNQRVVCVWEICVRFLKKQCCNIQLFLLMLLSVYFFINSNTAEIICVSNGYKKSILRNISWLYDNEIISFLHYVTFLRISHGAKEPVFLFLLVTFTIFLISAVFVFLKKYFSNGTW